MRFFFLLFFFEIILLNAQNTYSTKSNWLLDTKSDKEKFKAIQKQFRGFDLAMVEVGYRFNTFYFAIKDKNYNLANYQLDKIKKSIQNGIHKRPKRAYNSENMFLHTQYKIMKNALLTKDIKIISKEYENTKQICNACHRAEKVPFIEVIDPKYRWQPIR